MASVPSVLPASLFDPCARDASATTERPVLRVGWPALEAALPDGGLPGRSVVELQAPHVLGGSTFLALSAIRSLQHERPHGWCAWVDPEGSLYAPALAAAGLDLQRLLVVRPPRADLPRTAMKALLAGVFDLLVVDMAPVVGTGIANASGASPPRRAGPSPAVFIRQLALRAAETGTTVLLLSDARHPRDLPWPVALRLELAHTPTTLSLRVAKERAGRVRPAQSIPWPRAWAL